MQIHSVTGGMYAGAILRDAVPAVEWAAAIDHETEDEVSKTAVLSL